MADARDTSSSFIPPELRIAPPRAIRRRGGVSAKLIVERLFILPHTLVGLGVLFCMIGQPLFILLTPTVSGEVNDIFSTHTAKGGTRWNVNFDYPSERQGLHQFDSETVSPAQALRLHRGTRVLVHAGQIGTLHYATLARSFSDYVSDWWFVWMWGLVWNGIMAAVLYSAWVVPARFKRLVRDGEAVVGNITGKSTDVGKSSTSHRLKYDFRIAGFHPRHLAGEMFVNPEQYEAVAAGDAVVIVYDPIRPARHVLYEFSGFEAATA